MLMTSGTKFGESEKEKRDVFYATKLRSEGLDLGIERFSPSIGRSVDKEIKDCVVVITEGVGDSFKLSHLQVIHLIIPSCQI